MADHALSAELVRFLQDSVRTYEGVEVLLLLRRRADAYWSAPQLLGELRSRLSITEAEIAQHLELFAARGLVSVGADRRVQWRQGSSYHERLAGELAQAYAERPVTLIRTLDALREPAIQSFADAFRIGRKP